MEESKVIKDLNLALEGYIETPPDQGALEAAKSAKNLLTQNPSEAVEVIGQLFDGFKTPVTDAFSTAVSREAARKVSDVRKPLAAFYVHKRREKRESKLTSKSSRTKKADGFFARLLRRYRD